MNREGYGIKVLCLVLHRLARSPGQRFRFEQYMSFLQSHGFEFTISNLLSEKDDIIFYQKRKYLKKLLIFLKTIKIRYNDLRRVKDYDIVFIYREAVMHGSVYFEKQISKTGVPIIFDFDDAIWLMDVSEGNKELRWLKHPSKTAALIKFSTLTITGNRFLFEYAIKYNNNVCIIPSTVDIEQYRRNDVKEADKNIICIGWIGSATTLKHFMLAIPFLKKIINKYPGKIKIRLISDTNFNTDEIEIEFIKWSASTELDSLQKIDIGIMPLPDNEWSKGKCGMKGLQFMALEIPVIMSRLGVNTEIISDGDNGFLASSDEEWIEKISMLVELPALRQKLGKKGKQTVVDKYSFEANKQKWLNAFQSVINDKT